MIATPESKKSALEEIVEKGKITQCLYKYRPDNENTEKIFTDHTLWFDHPSNFNDPFDCWANIQTVDRKGMLDRLKQKGISKQEEQYFESLTLQQLIQSVKQSVVNVTDGYGICCFGMDEKNILMWSHYSEYHKGICLQFDVFEDPDFFTFALPVNYVDQMPNYEHSTSDPLETIFKPKSKCWEYEKEVRVVKDDDDIKNNGNSQAFKFKPESLKKVIFGCKAEQDTINKYKDLCKNNGLGHVTFSKMEQDPTGKFELIEKAI